MSEMDQVLHRLDRIERTLDELHKLIEKMAKVESILAQNAATHSKMWDRLDELEKRVRQLEIRIAQGSWIERVVWLAVAAVAALQAQWNRIKAIRDASNRMEAEVNALTTVAEVEGYEIGVTGTMWP